MKMMTFLFSVLVLGCDHKPVAVHETNNAKIQVEEMFTVDGCTVYRFDDGSYSHYFARCRESTSVEDGGRRQSGKTSYPVRDFTVATP
jgi:hypothetical protein